MDNEVLLYILSTIQKLTHTPVAVFNGETVIANFHSTTWFDLRAYSKKALDTEDEYNLYVSPQSLAFGMIKYEKYKILFGPIKVTPLTNTMLREIILDNKFHLEDVRELKTALDIIPTMQIEYFATLISSYYANLHRKIITANDILYKLSTEYTDIDVNGMLLDKQSDIAFGDKKPHNTYNYEQELLYYIRNGMLTELHNMGNISSDQNIDVVVTDTLRHYKNLLMAQKTLISRAAIEGGVDPETAFSLSDIYSHKIENCQSFNQISDLSYSMRDAFCKLVRDVKHPKTDDLLVSRAITYINNNVTEKITAVDIADSLGISREYLSSKFKKVIGKSIPDFICEQKIEIAKKLLKFSDKPIIAISNYLSFSSQSYFQTQFRKVTGHTPLEYRNKNM